MAIWLVSIRIWSPRENILRAGLISIRTRLSACSVGTTLPASNRRGRSLLYFHNATTALGDGRAVTMAFMTVQRGSTCSSGSVRSNLSCWDALFAIEDMVCISMVARTDTTQCHPEKNYRKCALAPQQRGKYYSSFIKAFEKHVFDIVLRTMPGPWPLKSSTGLIHTRQLTVREIRRPLGSYYLVD